MSERDKTSEIIGTLFMKAMDNKGVDEWGNTQLGTGDVLDYLNESDAMTWKIAMELVRYLESDQAMIDLARVHEKAVSHGL